MPRSARIRVQVAGSPDMAGKHFCGSPIRFRYGVAGLAEQRQATGAFHHREWSVRCFQK
jgi:hypothetical protein